MPTLLEQLLATSPWELTAVLLAIAYLVLAIRQNIWCWAAAIASTSIYTVLMFQAQLYMESALQVFYVGMAVYGWWCWSGGLHEEFAAEAAPTGQGSAVRAASAANSPLRKGLHPRPPLKVTTWPLSRHLPSIAIVLALSALSGFLLERHTDAALPYLDSFTTWGAILATWMVARKLLENWYWWLVIDSAAIYLYLNRGLYLTAALFAFYLVLIVIGWLAWRRSMRSGGRGLKLAEDAA